MGVSDAPPDGRAARQRYRFGAFEVDLRAGEIRKSGIRLRLTGQPVQVLEVLLFRAGEVVTRDELQRRLWSSDTFVDFEHNLNSAVKRLRAALNDSADAPRFIETVPRVGYRFIAPLLDEPAVAVTQAPEIQPAIAALDTPTASFRSWPLALAVGAVGAAALMLAGVAWSAGWLRGRAEVASPTISSVAVLPLREVSAASGVRLSDGVTGALVNALARLTALRVVPHASVMAYRNTELTIPAIADALRVDAVVEGSVTRVGERVHIAVQLVHASTDHHLWAAGYNGALSELLSLQERASMELAAAIRDTSVPPDRRRYEGGPVPPEVRALYLKGRHLLRRRTLPQLRRALQYFEDALKAAPDYAQAHAGVAAVWVELARLPTSLPSRESFARAKSAALAALRLDAGMVEALTSLAYIQETFERDFVAAERTYRRAIEHDPGYALARQRYATHLVRTGRPDEGVEMARFARDLDPASVNANIELGQAMISAGRPQDALEPMLAAVELEPSFFDPHVHLGELYAQLGRFDDAVTAGQQAVALSNRSAHALQALAIIYARAGRIQEAAPLIEELENHPTQRSAWDMAMIHLAADQHDRAFHWLRQACLDRPPALTFLKSAQATPVFDPIRDDPRFRDILECAEPAA